MIGRLSISSEGISPDKVAERALQLLKDGCPAYSTAWYQAYDELLLPSARAVTSSAVSPLPAVSALQPVNVLMPPQPQVVTLAVSPTTDELRAKASAAKKVEPPAAAPKRPSPNSVKEVLAADELDFDALSAHLSERAVMAYGTKQEIETELGTEQDCTNAKYFEEGPTVAFGFTLHKHAFVAFRGSRLPFRKNMPRSESIEILWSDWIRTDFNFIPWYWPMRHLGFARAWSRVRKQVFSWLRSLPEDSRRLVLTGHSLGGALALVAAFDLVEHYPIRAVITFGVPRVGLPLFRRSYHMKRCGARTLHAITRRYTHETDLVSRFPPPVLYCHVGDESVVRSSGAIEKGRPVGRIVRLEEWLESSSLKQASKPVLISMPPPQPTPVPSLPRDVRTKVAVWKFVQKLRVVVPLVMHDSSRQLLWLLSSGVGVLLCAAAWQDVLRHSSGKYVAAYEKKYPKPIQQTNPMSMLVARIWDAELAKLSGIGSKALKERPSPRK
jgi:hypothetical protein